MKRKWDWNNEGRGYEDEIYVYLEETAIKRKIVDDEKDNADPVTEGSVNIIIYSG